MEALQQLYDELQKINILSPRQGTFPVHTKNSKMLSSIQHN